MTHLYLRLFGTEVAANNQIGTFKIFLPQFKRLTHLTLDNGYFNRNVGDPNVLVLDILKTCPNLVKIDPKSCFPLLGYEEGSAAKANGFKTNSSNSTEPLASTEVSNMIDKNKATVETPNNYDYGQQQLTTAKYYCPNLKLISLRAPSINIKHLVEHYITSSLEELELGINREVFDTWAQLKNQL